MFDLTSLTYKPLAFIILLGIFPGLYAQDVVQSTDVSYAKVNAISSTSDTLFIEDAASFDAQGGDIIMIIQMKGAFHCVFGDTVSKPLFEGIECTENTGIYEFVQIENINKAENYFTLTRTLERPFTSGESIQAVKSAFYFDDAEVNTPITVTPWDPVKGYGGVFPIIAYRKITLNATINANAAGFKGGALDTIAQNWDCAPVDDSLFYHSSQVTKAALKGEGFLSERYLDYTRGRGYAANGGGGGSGKYSGGAGGGNFGSGGDGGRPMLDCPLTENVARGGVLFNDYFYENEENRIVFGGGGGAAPQNYPLGPLASPGASGGGLILILCDTIEGGEGMLTAKGGNALLNAKAGAGGGGGGGGVLVDARGIKNTLSVDVSGGKGGDVDPSSCTGPGGGGGAGIFWHSWETIPSQVQVGVSGGDPGTPGTGSNCINLTGFSGGDGGSVGGLRVPLNGFFFNSIRGDDVICGGMRPDTIYGTEPKGGNGDFEFSWQSSADGEIWSTYPSDPADSINFQPGVLYDTTYFRRLVTFEGVTDTSLSVRIDVWPQILNNDIDTNQTICEADVAEILTVKLPTGGDESFNYRWEKSTDLMDWETVQQSVSNDTYSPGQLFDTTYYRRYVESVTVCQDYSDTVKINVQGALTNFNISADHQSCYDFPADTLKGESGLQGGDRTNFYFFWQQREQNEGWTVTGNDTLEADYHPGILYDTIDYRRIVVSGMCEDTSNTVTVQVLDQIGNNLISSDEKICYATEADLLTGNGALSGGNKIDYLYNWQYSHDQNQWVSPGSNENPDFSTGVLYDTTFYRRITTSSACTDTSNLVKITVVPQIFNSLESKDTTVCQNYFPDLFDEEPASGGNSIFDYTWQSSTELSNWAPAEGVFNTIDYQARSLQDTTYFRRKVVSDICTDYSDTLKITVLPALQSNEIDLAPLTYTCYEIPKLITALEPSGGNGTYGYVWEESVSSTSWSSSQGNNSALNYTTPPLQDSSFYRRIVQSGEYSQCMDTSDVILVRINELPVGLLANNDTAICDGEPLSLNVMLSGKAPWEIYLSDTTAHTINSKSSGITKIIENTNVSAIQTVEIDSLIDANLCKATNLEGSVRIVSYENPDPEILAAPNFCGDTGQVFAKPPKFPAHWKGENLNFLDSLSLGTTVVSGVYDLPQQAIWYEANNICFKTDTADIIFYKQPVAETNFEDTTIYNTFHLELDAPVPEYDSVIWYALEEDVTVADAGLRFANYVFPEGNNTEYHLIYRINNGECFVTDTLALLIDDIFEPNAFSPNGDGINDYFYIEGLDEEGERKLTIINPWGNIVRYFPDYDLSDVNKLWDGTDEKGRPLPEGTYYYSLQVEDRKPIKGFIILKRREL